MNAKKVLMISPDEVKSQIETAFAAVEYPGDSNLRNSNEGDEPYLLEAEFKGMDDWRSLSAEFIDQAPDGFASALGFFSAEAVRFYLPAYLIADLEGKLLSSDPVFLLTYGLTDSTMDVRINPRRYGEHTWFDYVSNRFEGFTIAEAKAIIAYLELKRASDLVDFEKASIDQAIANYWRDRADRTQE
jgi:hypothetical protein